MSRIGKQPIPVPAKVSVKIDGVDVTVKGPRGELSQAFHPDITIKQEEGQLLVERPTDQRHHRALHGLTRALLNNMVVGVSEGFSKALRIEGVGYTANMDGQTLVMKLGYSHDVIVEPPQDIAFSVEDRGRRIIVEGIDKQVVGQVAAEIRGWRPPEPYKGKGVRYEGERVRRKAGKAGRIG
ncbi:MAG: 50S ribosomal protein L6 [Anaerolineae bacterium]|nr:50S ribosomal protein L6 [Anaerolineae bacterium]